MALPRKPFVLLFLPLPTGAGTGFGPQAWPLKPEPFEEPVPFVLLLGSTPTGPPLNPLTLLFAMCYLVSPFSARFIQLQLAQRSCQADRSPSAWIR